MKRAKIDWKAVQDRVRASEIALEAALTPNPQRVEEAFRQRAAGEWRALREAQPVDHGRGQVAQADGVEHLLARRRVRGEDHQRDSDLLEVDADGVAGVAVLAERLAMIRGDDHIRVGKEPLAPQLVE